MCIFSKIKRNLTSTQEVGLGSKNIRENPESNLNIGIAHISFIYLLS